MTPTIIYANVRLDQLVTVTDVSGKFHLHRYRMWPNNRTTLFESEVWYCAETAKSRANDMIESTGWGD